MTQAGPAHTTNLVISVSDLVVNDGEPRIFDLRLAEALGFSNIHAIRALIGRHVEALRQFGAVSLTQEKPGKKGGRPGKAYYLNRKQSLYIAAKSDTERAADIAIQMVEVFDEFLKGSLPPPAPVQVRAHTRTRPKPAPTLPPPALDRDGLALLRVAGETLLVDMDRYRLGPDDQAVRVHFDGSVTVGTVLYDGAPNWWGARCAKEPPRPPRPDESEVRRRAQSIQGNVLVFGAVVERRMPKRPGRDEVVAAAPRPGRTRKLAPSVPVVADLKMLEVVGRA